MTATNQKKIRVIAGTGTTGIQQVIILTAHTGPTGSHPEHTQISGFTGPTGTFKNVQKSNANGPTGTLKTIVVPGYTTPS